MSQEISRSRSRSPDDDSRRTSQPIESKMNQNNMDQSTTTSNMPVLSATATPEDEERPTYNIWAGDLDPQVTEHDLMNAFEPCGNIHSASIVRDRVNGTSRGYGFINFTTPESRKMALDKFGDNTVLYGKKIQIKMSESKNSVYIGALPKDAKEEDIRNKVREWAGPFEHLYYKPLTGYAFVEYINHMKAEKAYQIMKNQTWDGQPLKIQPAQSREKKAKFQAQQHATTHHPSTFQSSYQRQGGAGSGTTLFIKNIHETIDSDKLKEYTSHYGDVVKATVVTNPNTNTSRGYGFVEFSNTKDAHHAQQALHNTMWHGKCLGVEFSQKGGSTGRGAAPSTTNPRDRMSLPMHPTYGYMPSSDGHRLHDPRDFRFASAYSDRGYPSIYSDRGMEREREQRERRRSRDITSSIYSDPYNYSDPRATAYYDTAATTYSDYPSAYSDPYTSEYTRTRDYDRDRVTRYPEDRLDERVSSRTLRERGAGADRDLAKREPERSRDRVRERDDRYGSPNIPLVASDHMAMMDRYGAYALLEQQYRTGLQPRTGVSAERDADYSRGGSQSAARGSAYRY